MVWKLLDLSLGVVVNWGPRDLSFGVLALGSVRNMLWKPQLGDLKCEMPRLSLSMSEEAPLRISLDGLISEA